MTSRDHLAQIAEALWRIAARLDQLAPTPSPEATAVSADRKPRPGRHATPILGHCDACGVEFDTQGWKRRCASCFTPTRTRRRTRPDDPDRVAPRGADLEELP